MGAGTVAVLDQMEKWAKQLKRGGGVSPAPSPAPSPATPEATEETPPEDGDDTARMLELFDSELNKRD